MPMAVSIFQPRLSCALLAKCWGITRVNDLPVTQRRYSNTKIIQSTAPQRGTVWRNEEVIQSITVEYFSHEKADFGQYQHNLLTMHPLSPNASRAISGKLDTGLRILLIVKSLPSNKCTGRGSPFNALPK